MTDDLRTLLHAAAASPAGTTDYEALAARGRAWRRAVLAGSAVVLMVVVSVAVVALQAPPDVPVIGDGPTPTESARSDVAQAVNVLAVVEAPTGDAGRAVATDQTELDAYFQQWRYLSPSRPPTLGRDQGALIVAIESSHCRSQQLAVAEVTFGDVATVHFTAEPAENSTCLGDGRLVYVIAVARDDASSVSDVTGMLRGASIDAGWSRPSAWPPQQWYGPDDRGTPSDDVVVVPGPAHCDHQDIAFLSAPARSDREGLPVQYVRDPFGYLVDDYEHVEDAVLPEDATPSGYWTTGWQLWFAESDDAAYLVADDGHVERWPPYLGSCA